MDINGIKTSLLGWINDHLDVAEYGHGALVHLPLHFCDDDSITLMVEPFGDSVRVTDRGMTSLRLHMSDLNPNSDRVRSAWDKSIATLRLFDLGSEEGELAASGERSRVGELVWRVAEASIRIDQLRWMATSARPRTFADRVVDRIQNAIPRGVKVEPRMTVELRSGRTRTVTAGITKESMHPVLVQAVGGATRESKEDALERCFHVFSLTTLPKSQNLAVFVGDSVSWDEAMAKELEGIADVAFFDEAQQVEEAIRRHLEPART